MVPFRKILFPVDFSDRCLGAAHYVEALAGRFGAEVILLHVVETTMGQPGDLDFGGMVASLQWEDRIARTQELLNHYLESELGFLNVQRRLETGDPARAIVDISHKETVDLVMMPTHGYGGFRRFILGSVTAKVLHDVACPVWTGVHMENAPPLDEISIRSVVCAVDLTTKGEPPLRWSADLADEYGASLTLVHAVPGSEALPERLLDAELRTHLISQARQQLTNIRGELSVPVEIEARAGDVQKVVSSIAAEHKADLVVIGRGHHTGLGRLRTHSYAIIRESPCPVLSV